MGRAFHLALRLVGVGWREFNVARGWLQEGGQGEKANPLCLS